MEIRKQSQIISFVQLWCYDRFRRTGEEGDWRNGPIDLYDFLYYMAECENLIFKSVPAGNASVEEKESYYFLGPENVRSYIGRWERAVDARDKGQPIDTESEAGETESPEIEDFVAFMAREQGLTLQNAVPPVKEDTWVD